MMRRLRPVIGLGLLGYGLLVVLRILAHDALLAGGLSLVLGLLLLATGLPVVEVRRGRLVAAIGAVAVGGVLGYNVATGSGLGGHEWGLLLYGALLLVAATRLDRAVGRTQVGTLVGWSFPLLLAPLLLFALNAVIAGNADPSAGGVMRPLIAHTLVLPMAWGLALFGTPTDVVGTDVLITTTRGTLTLGIGLVCAGLYPMVLFTGVLALHAWREGLPPRRLAAYLALGFVGLWVANLLRLVLLAKVGVRYGAEALTTVHAHIGWVLFALFMALYWAIVLRYVEGPRTADPA